MKTEHICPGCKKTKPIDEFRNKNGCCRTCKAARMRAYRLKAKEHPDYVRELREYIPLPCEIAFRCSEIRNNWSPRMERLRSGFTEQPLEVEFVAIGGMRRKVFR